MANWLSGYNKRIKLTVDSTKIDEDLTHFPLTIFLKSGNGATDQVFDEVGSNWKKIAVTKSDGETQLYVEVEHWDATNKVGVLHVSKSDFTISSTADTELYLYFDANAADNDTYVGDTGNRTEVWDSNFKAVWHLNQDPSGTAPQEIDSTANNNDGTTGGSMTSDDLVDGKVGKALDFDGSDDYVDIAGIDFTSVFTIEAWVKRTSDGVYPHIIGREKWIGLQAKSSAGWQIVLGDGTNWTEGWYTANTTLANNTWYHIAFVKNGSTSWNAYLNGSDDGSGTPSASTAINCGFWIGSREEGTSDNFWPGILDEIRISNTNRSAAWIKATYYSTSDSLLTYGSVETGTTTETIELSDTFTLSESLFQKAILTISDTVSLSEKLLQKVSQVLEDSLSLSESIVKVLFKTFTDNLNLSEKLLQKAKLTVSETINVSEGLLKKVFLTLTDNLSLSEKILKKVSVIFTDTFTILEKVIKKFADWMKTSKSSASWTKQSKSSTSWTLQSKSSASWTKQSKSDIESTIE